MRTDVARDLSASSFDFQRIVWPEISSWFGDGELVLVESVSDRGFAQDMDIHAGIDAFHIQRKESLICGIGTRVQWVDEDRRYDTFSIRYARMNGVATEYEKRLRALNDPWRMYVYPYFTVQAYLTKPKRKGRLLSVAAVRTAELFRAATEVEGWVKDRKCSRDWGLKSVKNAQFLENAKFLFLSWRYLQSVKKICVKTWCAAEGG